MKKNTLYLLMLISVLLTSCKANSQFSEQTCRPEQLEEGFMNPPAQARPFVRWWWNGNCVTEQEVLRELDLMKQAGIGGVEINPIGMPEEADATGVKALAWLSPEWNHMVKSAAEGARSRGMIADLLVGSGWPFGGKFLKPNEMIQGIGLNTVELTGPKVFEGNLQELIKAPGGHFKYDSDNAPELLFLSLVPADNLSPSARIDMLNKVAKEGTVRFEIPAGKHVLYVGVTQKGFRRVMHGAPGADGPVLDHYNKQAVQGYLDRTTQRLSPSFNGRLGNGLRSIFCDSIELSGSNWTLDMRKQFRQRRGYDVMPYLPFVLQTDKQTGNSDSTDAIRRARYDFSKTLVELYNENFLYPLHDWCNENGTRSRYQAYGWPWLMGMLDGYLVPDIPEGDTWLFNGPKNIDAIRYSTYNKYASSGAHLTGKPIVGCEAMTNTSGVFSATLEYIKQASDITFITGCNNFVLHGFNYSPPEAGFPGWVRYGCYFNEQNPFWPYMKYWADYNSRVSFVMQNSRPVVQVAIFGPEADVWSRGGLDRVPFLYTPNYLHKIWQAVSNNGCSADYVNDTVLQGATFENGRLNYGPMQYELLLVSSVETLQPKTALAIQAFAQAGGKIAFIEKLPARSPSLQNASQNDRIVAEAVGKAVGQNDVRQVDPPGADLVGWTAALLDQFKVSHSVRLDQQDWRVFQIHRRIDTRDIYFFSNQHRDKTFTCQASFPMKGKTAWRWDPETGHKTVFAPAGANPLPISLSPLESLLLVFEPSRGETIAQGVSSEGTVAGQIPLNGPWQVKLERIDGQTREMTQEHLMDFAENDDRDLQTFGGTVTYTITFDAPQTDSAALDLGLVHGVSEVKLNGQPLGVRWWGQHRYEVPILKKQGNVLTIKISTVLLNYAKSLKENPTARKWTQKQPLRPVGLVGPVQLEILAND